MAGQGNTGTISFGTSGFTADFTFLGGAERTRESLEDSHLGTLVQKTFQPEELFDPGESAIRFWWDQSFATFPPIDQPPEEVTITYPLKEGETTAGILAGTAFLTRDKAGDMENGTLMEGEGTLKWDGKTQATYTAGSAV